MNKPRLPVPEPSQTFHGSIGPVSSLEFIKSGPLLGHLFSGSLYSWVYLWDLTHLKRLKIKFQASSKAEKNTSVLWTLTLPERTDQMYVHLRNGILQKWSISQSCQTLLNEITIDDSYGFCPATYVMQHKLICAPCGSISSNSSGILLVSGEEFGRRGLLIPAENHGSPMKLVNYKADCLLCGYEDGVVALWDLRNEKQPFILSNKLRQVEEKECHTLMTLDADSELEMGIIGSSGSTLQRFRIGTSDFSILDALKLPNNGVNDLRIRADRKIVTVASWDFASRIYSWKSLRLLATLNLHTDAVQKIEYAEIDEHNFVILGGKDAMISIWPMY